jgi:hypothetical protein
MIGRLPRRRALPLSHPSPRPRPARVARPTLERLEDRFLLYSTTGSQWSKPVRITYSFVPDGTSIGGIPSNFQQTFNALFPTSTWQQQFQMAAAVWQKVANVNFVQVSDNGAAIGVSGNQQSDSRFGDIRIGGYAQASNVLAYAYLPAPYNGGTNAGDIFFNTAQSWQVNGTTYDLETVIIHELGHALGLGHSTVSSADAMWPDYTASKHAVTSDDTAGIRVIYNARQNDYFDANGVNNLSSEADDISPWINSQGQLTLSGLDSTTPLMIGAGDNDWYKITVPSNTNGTMLVKMQSTGLSVLSPSLTVYNSAGTTVLGQQSSLAYGDTVSVTITGVTAGQVYRILGKGATTGDSGYGAYALQVNFVSTPLPAVALPNTFVGMQLDQGGGTLYETAGDSSDPNAPSSDPTVDDDSGDYWTYSDWGATVDDSTVAGDLVVSSDGGPDGAGDPINSGVISGTGDSLQIGASLVQNGPHVPGPGLSGVLPAGMVGPFTLVPGGVVLVLLGSAGDPAGDDLGGLGLDWDLTAIRNARSRTHAQAAVLAVDNVLAGWRT